MTDHHEPVDRILAAGKSIIYHFLDYLQYFVSLTIVVAIVITLLSIPQQLGVLTDVGSESLLGFLEYIISVIISIELIHVLLHQTLDSIVEVLSLAITRELILQHLHTYEFLIGVLAVAVLFAIRKFLFINKKDKPLSKAEDNAVTIDEDGIHASTRSKPAASKVTAGLYGYRPSEGKATEEAAELTPDDPEYNGSSVQEASSPEEAPSAVEKED